MSRRRSVELDERQVLDTLNLFKFVGGNSDRAVRVAINKAGPKVRTIASKAIRSQVRLPAAYLNKKGPDGKRRLEFDRASGIRLVGRISTPSRGLLLARYATGAGDTGTNSRQSFASNGIKSSFFKVPATPKRGIRVKVKPQGGTKRMGKQFFFMLLRNSNALAIARRRPDGQSGPKGGKYEVLYGPSLSQVFTDVKDDVTPEASDIYAQELVNAIAFLLDKRIPKE